MTTAIPFDVHAHAAMAVHAYRRRARAIAGVFVSMAILIVLLGAASLEGINVLRSYAAGESHWSKAEKSAVVALERYIATGSKADYGAFEDALGVIDGDRRARLALENGRGDYAGAMRGFVVGENDAVDIPGLVGAFVLFHAWPPFAAAVADWKRGDAWIDDLAAYGRSIHRKAIPAAEARRAVTAFDRKLSANERGYSLHMNHASRTALWMTLLMFAAASALACLAAILFARRILSAGIRAQMRAIASEERVGDFAELATDWFCELDADLRVTYVSSPHFMTDNAALDTVQGRNWLDIGGMESVTEITSGHGIAIRAHEAFRGHRFRHSGGGRHVYWGVSGKPQFDSDGAFSGYRIIATDITEFMQTQHDLAKARDAAEQASRAKSSFLANMSHELRTPLNAILGFSELIEREAFGEVGNQRYLGYAGDIHMSGRHLLAIINDLLEHSRIEAGQLVLRHDPFGVASVIDDVRLLCQARADALNVKLHIDVGANIPAVLGDELRFRQVLINIVTNAVKFSPAGDVSVTARRHGGVLQLVVQDSGIGMDAAGIAQALRPFGQVDSGLNRKYEGTGLGLPLAKSLVELQGGTLAIESVPGTGTTVTMTFPFESANLESVAA